MADNVSQSSSEERKKTEEQFLDLNRDFKEIFAECTDPQPLKLQSSESGQFDNCDIENNQPSSSLIDVSSVLPVDHTRSVKNSPQLCEETPLIDQKQSQNDLPTSSDTGAASTEQLHADLTSIICELQRIATDVSETNFTNDVFQESAQCIFEETNSNKVPEKEQIEFLNNVMEDLDIMAERFEHEMYDTTNDNDPKSVAGDKSLIQTNASNFLKSENNADMLENVTGVDHVPNIKEKHESYVPIDKKERETQSGNFFFEQEDNTATAARKKFASTKSKKVEKGEESNIKDFSSTGKPASLKEEPPNKASGAKQFKVIQFLTGQRGKSKDSAKLDKTNSADFDLEAKDGEQPLRPTSMPQNVNEDTELSQPKTTITERQSGSTSFRDIVNKTTIKLENRVLKENGNRNLAFVESPHVAEVYVDRVGKATTSGAACNKDDDDANEVLDMEQLLSKLDLSDKIKRQIRQASQLSFQIQNKTTHHRSPRDMKQWRSLDTPTYLRATSQPAPSTPNPFRTLRPWKIPMAIKMMKNLRKQQSSIEEDRLSLEFFVPGKKTTIRLHRRTFFNFLLKYSIFFFTFIFWIGSLSCISYGAWMLTHKSNIIDNVTDVFLDPYVLLCVVGAVVFIVAFIGCLGALRENIYLLKIFHLSLTFVVVLEVFVGTLVFLFYTMPEFRTAVKVGPEEVLKSAVKRYFDDEVMRDWIDTVQKEFGCCGVSMSNKGYLDWQENQYFNCSDSNPSMHRCSVPLSCCIFEEGDFINYMCGAGIMKEEPTHISHIINTKGCMKSFGEWLAKNDSVIGFVGLGLIGLQILGVVSGRYFIKHLREGDPGRPQSDRIQIDPADETPAPAEA